MSDVKKVYSKSKGKWRFHLNLCRLLFVFSFLLCFFLSLRGQKGRDSLLENETVLRFIVLGNVNWTDTRLEVKEGQEIYFKTSGLITLQKGNPMAYCGPDGYDLKTVQQPLSDNNIGALIGKIVHLILIEVDEETGEEIRNEIVEKFYVGLENRVRMPISGRLFLGINENVVGDNSGEFKVEIYIRNNERS